MKEFIVHRRAMAGGCHLVFQNKNGMTVYRVKKQVCWMDDLPLADHKGNTMARIQCESLFVPNEYIISYPNDDNRTTLLRNESKIGPMVHIQDGNKNSNTHNTRYTIRADWRRRHYQVQLVNDNDKEIVVATISRQVGNFSSSYILRMVDDADTVLMSSICVAVHRIFHRSGR